MMFVIIKILQKQCTQYTFAFEVIMYMSIINCDDLKCVILFLPLITISFIGILSPLKGNAVV